MITVTKPAIRFLVDREGSRTDAVISMEVFQRMLNALENLEDIQDVYEAEKQMEGRDVDILGAVQKAA